MTGQWIAERMSHIQASGIRKVFDLARSLKDPVNLSIGQPHFDVPQAVKDAATQAIQAGKLSPVELVDALLARIERHEPKLRAFTAVSAERARDAAEAAHKAIRAGHVENGVHAMDFARYAPSRLYSHMARRAMQGELCSFFFAWTGAFLGDLERFCGAEILDGFHVAPVPPSPGSCVALSQRLGRLNATHVWQTGVLDASERALFDASLRADLLG